MVPFARICNDRRRSVGKPSAPASAPPAPSTASARIITRPPRPTWKSAERPSPACSRLAAAMRPCAAMLRSSPKRPSMS